ncbi:protein kinase [Striga asiatica]|uniref:Protein kinase n=1 Tax=Striga asiatica TaxID=4170 RepID=A0A5A7R6G8_STRAF|nr:protein kinase [Striga asiatica]
MEPNTSIHGCCHSRTFPLHFRPSLHSFFSELGFLFPFLFSPFLANSGAESVVYEGVLDVKKVTVKNPFLFTSDDLDKFHKELQLLSELLTGVVPYTDLRAEAKDHVVSCLEERKRVTRPSCSTG